MNKQIYIINGTGGSGKDTFVSMVAKYARVLNYSSIDDIKLLARQIGWNGQKDDKSRKFLSDLKKLITNYNDMPYRNTLEVSKQFLANDEHDIMFIHIREPKEIQRTSEALGAKTLLIKRQNYNNIETNSSDADVDNYNYDFIIENISLEQLEIEAKNFANNLNSKTK